MPRPWLIAVFALAGCGAFSSFEGFSGGADDDSSADAAPDGGSPSSEASTDDASADSGDCMRRPMAARPIALDGSVGFTCNVLEGIASDGKVAGLDTPSGSAGELAGRTVSACIAFEFDAKVGGRAVLDVATVKSACGGGCASEALCNGGAALDVFAGATVETVAFVEQVTLPTVAADAGITQRQASLPANARAIVLCRPWVGSYADPVIDGVRAACR